jgi:hypothetical protein
MLNKIIRYVLLLLFLYGTLVFLLPNTAYANPSMTTYDSRPTAHATTGGLTVTTPSNAYDGSLTTYAFFEYDEVTGSFEVKTFTQPSSDPIAFVDFKMNYEATSGDGTYKIVYYVNTTGPVVLLDTTSAEHAQATVTWSDQPEPIDGVWDWTDINSIRIIVQTGAGGGKADKFYEYEAWVTVTAYSKGTMSVTPASLTDPSSPFTVDIDIASVDDLYGWEFKLYYNNTILSNSTVTEGTFLSNAGSTFFRVLNNTDSYNATHGRFWVACTLTGDIAGASGSGTLATVTLTVDGPGGTTALELVDTKLVGYEYSAKKLVQMVHSTTDGSVTISGVPEFPFGVALEMALVMVIVYVWWRGRRKEPKATFETTVLPQKQTRQNTPFTPRTLSFILPK